MMESNLKRQINTYLSESLENFLTSFIDSMGFEPNLKKTLDQRISNFKCYQGFQSEAITYHILKLVTQKINKKLDMINEANKQSTWQERLISAGTIMILNDLKRELE
jgi:hypothetical protein